MSSPSVSPGQTGINLYGYLTSAVGLGVVARNTAGALVTSGRTVRAVDLTANGMARASDTATELLLSGSKTLSQQPIDAFHINPDRLRYLFTPWGGAGRIGTRPMVCVPFWEAPRLPRTWLPTLAAMDVLLAPSLFIRDAVLADLPDADVVHYPQAAPLPSGVTPDRQRWGIPSDTVSFVTSFAFASDVERKNPWAVLDAFIKAFGDDPTRLLVVKSTRPSPGTPGSAAHGRLREACLHQPNVRLIDDPLSYPDVLSLYASCDVLVSLHRAEGLGLSLLEAMGLGVPVVATAWSGNMDFMTERNSACVRYRLADIDVPRSSPYHARRLGRVTQWAEPDIDDAATWMRRLAEDPSLRASLGAAGRATARTAAEAFAAAHAWEVVDEIAASGRPRPARQIEAIARLRRTYVSDLAAYVASGTRRRLSALTGRER